MLPCISFSGGMSNYPIRIYTTKIKSFYKKSSMKIYFFKKQLLNVCFII